MTRASDKDDGGDSTDTSGHTVLRGDPSYPQLSRDEDLQKVTTSSKGEPNITECPEKLSDRVLWLENIQLDMESSEIGIRWMEPDCLLSCCLETENVDSRNALRNRTFNINTVIQYTVLLSDEPNQHFHLLRDKRGEMCQVEIPKRVWTKINRQVYSLLKQKIPIELRTLYQSIEKWDGFALYRRLAQPLDATTDSAITALENRMQLIRLTCLADWQSVRGNTVQLFADYKRKEKKGEIAQGEDLNVRTKKKFIRERFDAVLTGIAVWILTANNETATIDECLRHCDIICETTVSRLARKREHGEVEVAAYDEEEEDMSMYAANPPHSNSSHTPTRQAPPYQNQYAGGKGYANAGRGRGRGSSGWISPNYKGYVPQGKGGYSSNYKGGRGSPALGRGTSQKGRGSSKGGRGAERSCSVSGWVYFGKPPPNQHFYAGISDAVEHVDSSASSAPVPPTHAQSHEMQHEHEQAETLYRRDEHGEFHEFFAEEEHAEDSYADEYDGTS